jgi:hypothetical protein
MQRAMTNGFVVTTQLKDEAVHIDHVAMGSLG